MLTLGTMVLFNVARGHADHRNALQARVGLKRPAQGVTVHLGHHDIEQDQRR